MVTEEVPHDDAKVLSEALELALSTAGLPIPISKIKGIAATLRRRLTSQGKLESAYARLDSHEARAQLKAMVMEAVEPLVSAANGQQEVIDGIQRSLDQVIELMYRLVRPGSEVEQDSVGRRPFSVRLFEERVAELLEEHGIPASVWNIQVAKLESARIGVVFEPVDSPEVVWKVAVAAYSIVRLVDDVSLAEILNHIEWAGPVIEAVNFACLERPMGFSPATFERQEFCHEDFGRATLSPLMLGAKLRVAERIGQLPHDLSLSRVHSRLKLSRTLPYGVGEVQEWWSIYSIAESLDHELRHLDALFCSAGDSSLQCHGVQGAERPENFTELLSPRDWEVLDTSIKISKVHRIIRSLGGESLYGLGNTEAPLRELIQNASDAIRARRVLEASFGGDAGRIEIRLNERTGGWVLEVEDDGIGMSRECLSSVLLDFGVSYWDSHLAKVEHPSLQQSEFAPVGKYGVGFFSVFMLGRRVRISTRELGGARDTLTLEFVNGLEGQAAFRVAQGSECRSQPGTTISIWLDHEPHDQRDGLINLGFRNLGTGSPKYTLAQMCGSIAPALRVDLAVAEGADEATVVVKANDWETLSSEALTKRLYPLFSTNFVADSLLRLTTIRDRSGAVVARLALSGRNEFDPATQGFVTVGGMRGSSLAYLSGLIAGESLTMSRNQSEVGVEAELLAEWARSQVPLALKLPEHCQATAACVLATMGTVEDRLKIAQRGRDWVSMAEIREWAKELDRVQIITLPGMLEEQYLRFRLLNDFEPAKNVITMSLEGRAPASIYPVGHSWWPLRQGESVQMILNCILTACVEAWQPEDGGWRHGYGDPREIYLVGTRNGAAVEVPSRYIYNIERDRVDDSSGTSDGIAD